jgi:hypothetical protein
MSIRRHPELVRDRAQISPMYILTKITLLAYIQCYIIYSVSNIHVTDAAHMKYGQKHDGNNKNL